MGDRQFKPGHERKHCPCGKALYRNNKHGYCQVCYKYSPEFLERHKAWTRKKMADPANRERARALSRANRLKNKQDWLEKNGGASDKKCPDCGGPLKQGARCTVCSIKNHSKEQYAQRKADPALMDAARETGRRYWRRTHATPEQRVKALLVLARHRAKVKGVPFAITLEDLLPLPEFCPVFQQMRLKYCGDDQSTTYNTPSIDQIEPGMGYVKGNVTIMSWRANHLKCNGTPEELRAVADYAARMARKLSIVS